MSYNDLSQSCTGAVEYDYSQKFLREHLPNITFRVENRSTGRDRLDVSFSQYTFGEFADDTAQIWGNLLKVGNKSSKLHDEIKEVVKIAGLGLYSHDIRFEVSSYKRDLVRCASKTYIHPADVLQLVSIIAKMNSACDNLCGLLGCQMRSEILRSRCNRRTIESLRNKLGLLEQQVSQLTAEKESLDKQLTTEKWGSALKHSGLKTHNDKLSAENTALKEQVSALSTENETLKSQAADLADKLARTEEHSSNMRATIVHLETSVRKAEFEKKQLAMQSHRFKSELAEHEQSKAQVDRAHAELEREHERLKSENERLKSENARLVLAESKVTDLSTVLAKMKMIIRNQEEVGKVSHDHSLLTKEMQMVKEFEQLMQTRLREQKEKYKEKIAKIKAERNGYINKCLELKCKNFTTDKN